MIYMTRVGVLGILASLIYIHPMVSPIFPRCNLPNPRRSYGANVVYNATTNHVAAEFEHLNLSDLIG